MASCGDMPTLSPHRVSTFLQNLLYVPLTIFEVFRWRLVSTRVAIFCASDHGEIPQSRRCEPAVCGRPNDRVDLLLDRSVAAANVFASQLYVVEQQGFRKIVDTTFMIGFLFSADSDLKDVEGYFNAMRRAQQDIDRDLGLYKHYYLRELPPRFHDLVDVQAFGPGERLVFEPYTREMYESTHSWMYSRDLFPEQDTRVSYETAVVA